MAVKYSRSQNHRAHYTLDMGDGIANECVIKQETPEEAYIKEETTQEIQAAIENLTEAQKRRLRQRYFEGMKIKQIADMEGVNHSTICYSLRASLKSLKKQTQIKRFRE
ncbi:MAG: sigma-70 family RNA polymerase sigma factor [Lachnospiraceae bacterium]